MSYAIVDDGDQINIRAIITQRWELAELVEKLQRRVDGLPLNITTTIQNQAPSADVDAAIHALAKAAFEPDAQDVNQKELSNER